MLRTFYIWRNLFNTVFISCDLIRLVPEIIKAVVLETDLIQYWLQRLFWFLLWFGHWTTASEVALITYFCKEKQYLVSSCISQDFFALCQYFSRELKTNRSFDSFYGRPLEARPVNLRTKNSIHNLFLRKNNIWWILVSGKIFVLYVNILVESFFKYNF